MELFLRKKTPSCFIPFFKGIHNTEMALRINTKIGSWRARCHCSRPAKCIEIGFETGEIFALKKCQPTQTYSYRAYYNISFLRLTPYTPTFNCWVIEGYVMQNMHPDIVS